MSPIDTNNFTTEDTEKCSIAKAQNKDFKTAIMNMLKNLKEDKNKSINETYKNTNGEMKLKKKVFKT